jgi:OmpA-OmpF porin, OOP family
VYADRAMKRRRSKHARSGWLLLALAAGCSAAPPPSLPPPAKTLVVGAAAIAEPLAPGLGIDRDCDGIADDDDKCPVDAEDRDGFQDQDGCPDLDNDQDRFLDPCDQCPNEPETYNGYQDEDGCPDRALVIIEKNEIQILVQVHFAQGSDRILPESRAVVDAAADILKNHPEFERIATLGHASIDEPGAQRLSERRAEQVKRAIAALGIDPVRIEAHGYGSTRPIVDNALVAQRPRNRRVEFAMLRANGEDRAKWDGKQIVSLDPPPRPPPPPRPKVEPCVVPPAKVLPEQPCRADLRPR